MKSVFSLSLQKQEPMGVKCQGIRDLRSSTVKEIKGD